MYHAALTAQFLARVLAAAALAGCASNSVTLGTVPTDLWSTETTPLTCTITKPNGAPALGSSCVFVVQGAGSATPSSVVIPLAPATGAQVA